MKANTTLLIFTLAIFSLALAACHSSLQEEPGPNTATCTGSACNKIPPPDPNIGDDDDDSTTTHDGANLDGANDDGASGDGTTTTADGGGGTDDGADDGGADTGDGGGEDLPGPEETGKLLGSFEWTYYWIVFESDYSGTKDTPIYDRDGNIIAYGRKDFVKDRCVEGTGYLTDGTLVNLWGSCKYGEFGKCFFVVDNDSNCIFGIGAEGNCLTPFRSVAADLEYLPFGTKLYIPALDGKQMPGPQGFTHDGCVTVDDEGSSIIGAHLDFFAEKESYYEYISWDLLNDAEYVDVYFNTPKCQ